MCQFLSEASAVRSHMKGINGSSPQPCYYVVQVENIPRYNMIRAIKVSYLILIDEEKHDGQNLQDKDEQEEDEELWRHKWKVRRQLSHLTPHLSICRKRPQGGIMGICL